MTGTMPVSAVVSLLTEADPPFPELLRLFVFLPGLDEAVSMDSSGGGSDSKKTLSVVLSLGERGREIDLTSGDLGSSARGGRGTLVPTGSQGYFAKSDTLGLM